MEYVCEVGGGGGGEGGGGGGGGGGVATPGGLGRGNISTSSMYSAASVMSRACLSCVRECVRLEFGICLDFSR